MLERLFRDIAAFFDNLADRVAFCSDCGRNIYTGEPCKGRSHFTNRAHG